MADKPLSNKKVAILVESQYIPEELRAYREKFEAYGATCHFVSRLWGQSSQTFISELEDPQGTPETFRVDIDVESVRPEDYAAVIMAANYTSVRLRYFSPPHTMRDTPAVKFFADAMRNPRIVKGALCHGLWILTPTPELLTGRKVICHEVVASDIVNAGAVITPSTSGIVVDRDLVTGHSKNEAGAMVDAIKELLTAPALIPDPPRFSLSDVKPGRRRVLVLLSEFGYWGEELVGPVEVFDAAGYRADFLTPTGKRPVAITVSMNPEYTDPPLGRSVTSKEVAARTREWDDPATVQGRRLETPLNLSEWFPDRPYWSAPQFIRAMEHYNRALDRARREIENYDALLIVGGSGPICDLANNHRVHDLILGFHRADKPIAAECYGVACLAFARELEDRKSLIWGKHVTGHCKEYDYKDGTGFMKARGQFYDINMGPPPYPLEYILRDATGPEGGFHGNVGRETSVIVDYPFITGRSTPDSYLTGQKLVEVLDGEPPLRRFGW
ncbi:DJ-1/PfpI family protein [Syntrophobacter fumaroxidans]|uniref:ThiJ/PfpI domain protein n=1 Tax=Syntrophobacter fumaroxidans (strain DSM 10017 / MPOB) TaxID=335543 RepID=A0LF55_SYNFM|nr:DJ-1/PfpI family protein [Syntrophobacter fumaroxidans]ABK16057.1 ThiJ/PfpI domain protein [Syntrophobacter fumaroxidans MPOB]